MLQPIAGAIGAPKRNSGAQLVAAARTAGSKHLAPANGGRAGAKAMAASTDKVAGLEGALHVKTSGIRMSSGRSRRKPVYRGGPLREAAGRVKGFGRWRGTASRDYLAQSRKATKLKAMRRSRTIISSEAPTNDWIGHGRTIRDFVPLCLCASQTFCCTQSKCTHCPISPEVSHLASALGTELVIA